ncbi:hypothetical protein [Phenylobacterium sp.]|uniref:hypothetical protein n=1 Tax=Phenylobacterium sp. TaxID=1871053 RepID=UPI003D2A73AA
MRLSRDTDQPSPTLNATRARQGRWGRHIFWVLVFGTVLAALGLFAAWGWRAPDLAASEPTRQEKKVEAETFDTPAPPSVTRQAP